MKHFVFQIVALVAVIVAGFFLTSQQVLFNKKIGSAPGNQKVSPEKKLKIIDQNVINGDAEGTVINIEIADTKEKRSKGLGGRQSLASDSGMLFIFDKTDKFTFWMKGLSFPLDFIWIKDDEIVEISPDIPFPESGQKDEDLPRYTPATQINKVLEVNGGFSAANNVKVGDKIEVQR
ncbi:DUF192 domain-containing protein [Candidatus Daviesbacteria bacterium]|nr:DUF192 domain-containing protein [Candidatus Daviesbacteria bacterium]